jgi:hypothetical protein
MDLETVCFYYNGPYTVEGTPFALNFGENFSSDKHVLRDGKRDEKLTSELRSKFGQRPALSVDSRLKNDIAAWLREVHASEQPKRLELEANSTELYSETGCYCGGGVLRDVRAFTGNLRFGTRIKITVEEIKS